MHEIGALDKAINLVEDIAEKNDIQVTTVVLEVGELTGYIPVFFEKYFPILASERERLKDAKLKMIIIKGQAVCSECDTFYNVMKHKGICPKCHSRNKKIISGQEFLVKNIEYEVDA